MEQHDPFQQAPTTPPVSTDPVTPIVTPTGPHRGRRALATVAALGLVGAGVVGVTQFAGASGGSDDAIGLAAPDDDPNDDEPTDDEPADDGSNDDEPADTESGDADDGPSVDGEIVIDLGDDEPIVIDLGGLDGDVLDEFHECVGFPELGEFDGPLDLDVLDGDLDDLFPELDGAWSDLLGELDRMELPELGEGPWLHAEGGHVTVFGPDGVQVVDLGDGDSSVTITQTDGEIEITTDGDATVDELPGIGDISIELPAFAEELDLDAMLENLPSLDELADLPALDLPEPEAVQDCLDALG